MRTTETLPYPRQDKDGTKLGFDLSLPINVNLVKKILRTKLRTPHGYTYQDWCQEVLLVLWKRNHQPSAYDPRKGSPEAYITCVARSLSLKSEKKYFATSPQLVYYSELPDKPFEKDEKWKGAELGTYDPNDFERFDNQDQLDHLNYTVDQFLKGTL